MIKKIALSTLIIGFLLLSGIGAVIMTLLNTYNSVSVTLVLLKGFLTPIGFLLLSGFTLGFGLVVSLIVYLIVEG